jgi:cytochrome b6-f complex iron-sulfur subunit
MADTPENPGTNPPAGTPAPGGAAPLTPEEKQARLEAAGAKNAAAAAAKAAGGAAPAPAPAAPLTAEEKQARLDAARAKNAAAAAAKAGGAAAPAAPAASAAPAAAPAATAIATAAKPAAAATKPAAAATAKKAPEILPPPPQLQTRRTFMEWSIAAWTVFFVWLAGIGHMFLRFMFPNVLYEQDPKFIAGKRSDFPEINKVYENYKQAQAVWVVRLKEEGQDRLVALSTVCTHLGCTPNWLEAEQKYKCPCHGSGYYLNGVNFEGPTPRPLERFRVFTDSAGNIVVDKAKKFRQDLGEWNQNESYVTMS